MTYLKFYPISKYVSESVDKIADAACSPELEVRLTGGAGKILFSHILRDVIPGFLPGKYAYRILNTGNNQQGSCILPSSFEMLPENLRQLSDIQIMLFNLYLKIHCKSKTFILEEVRKHILGTSLFSDELPWLKAILESFQKENLLETPAANGIFPGIPKFMRNCT